jgi:glucose-6-phosphate dehydrogenase assembly protein OpcA
VAEAVALDRWEGTDVRLGEVTDTLTRLRNRAARTATRVTVMTLVVLAGSEDEADRALEALHALGNHHPARIILLRPEPVGAGSGIDARVAICEAGDAVRPVTFDEVRLTVRGEAAGHLSSIIEPFTLSDLPVVLWYPGALPPVTEGLLADADALLVDCKESGEAFAPMSELARRRVLVDLTWARLRPWRELVAALFMGPAYRPFAGGVTWIEVAGKPGPRRLMAGWLLSRLRVGAEMVHLEEDRHVQITIHASVDGVGAEFRLTRQAGARVVRAGAHVEGGPSHEEVLGLPDNSLAWSLGQALTHLSRDRVWEASVTAAIALGR